MKRKPREPLTFPFIQASQEVESLEEERELNHEFKALLDAWWDLAVKITEEELREGSISSPTPRPVPRVKRNVLRVR